MPRGGSSGPQVVRDGVIKNRALRPAGQGSQDLGPSREVNLPRGWAHHKDEFLAYVVHVARRLPCRPALPPALEDGRASR